MENDLRPIFIQIMYLSAFEKILKILLIMIICPFKINIRIIDLGRWQKFGVTTIFEIIIYHIKLGALFNIDNPLFFTTIYLHKCGPGVRFRVSFDLQLFEMLIISNLLYSFKAYKLGYPDLGYSGSLFSSK